MTHFIRYSLILLFDAAQPKLSNCVAIETVNTNKKNKLIQCTELLLENRKSQCLGLLLNLEIPHMFTRSHIWPTVWVIWIQSRISHSISVRPILIFPNHAQVFQDVSFVQISQQTFRTHLFHQFYMSRLSHCYWFGQPIQPILLWRLTLRSNAGHFISLLRTVIHFSHCKLWDWNTTT